METDVLVLGFGLAGLRAAESAVKWGCRVLVVGRGAGASPGVIGFNAPVGKGDSVERFRADIERNGAGLAVPELTAVLAGKAGESVADLERLGISFDRREGEYQLLQPLGCSVPRLVHLANRTGPESIRLIRDFLLQSGVGFLPVAGVAALVKNGGAVCGAEVILSETETRFIAAKAVVLALGGGGSIYAGSTYPGDVTGSGYALALEAGAELCDMEFVQFEPCRGIWPRPLGISTTLLSHGGSLYNGEKRVFLLKEARDCSKAELAFFIGREIFRGRPTPHGGVWLDLSGVPEEELTVGHAMYYRRFLGAGIDLKTTPVEVAPAAHTFLGGVRIDAACRTSVSGLFAAGEVTGGVHGANRIGGNAGTEVYVFGRIAGESAAHYAQGTALPAVSFRTKRKYGRFFGGGSDIGEILQTYAGVIRTPAQLAKGAELLSALQPASLEEAQRRRVALSVVESALKQPRSLGVHQWEE